MGILHFAAPEGLPDAAVERAYMVGLEGIPWPGRNKLTSLGFSVERINDESGQLHITWPVPGHGELTLSTASLMEREEPYELPLELVRGTLNRVRNQLAYWQLAGLVASPELQKLLHQATREFAAALVARAGGASAPIAASALPTSLLALRQLAADYTQQALALRHKQAPRLGTLLATALPARPVTDTEDRILRDAFNTVVIRTPWRTIEPEAGKFAWDLLDQQVAWARAAGLRVACGPLLQLDRRNVPDWLYLWDDDMEAVQGYVAEYTRAVAERYRGKVNLWLAAGRLSSPDVLNLSEEQRLRMSVQAIETLRELDSRTPLIVGFDRPWGEQCSFDKLDLSPLHFADALVRAEIGVSGLGLEMDLGYWPGGTLPRDPLEISRLVDRWSAFNLPLLVTLSLPSANSPDAQALADIRALDGGAPAGVTPEGQRQLIETIVPLLLAKQPVQGIVWSHWDDRQSHDFPHCGLVDTTGRTKPALTALARIRKEHLL